MKSLLDPTFVYVPSVATDLKKTFERVRREQAQQKQGEFEIITNLPADNAGIRYINKHILRRNTHERT